MHLQRWHDETCSDARVGVVTVVVTSKLRVCVCARVCAPDPSQFKCIKDLLQPCLNIYSCGSIKKHFDIQTETQLLDLFFDI